VKKESNVIVVVKPGSVKLYSMDAWLAAIRKIVARPAAAAP